MPRLFPLLFLCLFVPLLISCNKDDDEDVSPNLRLLTDGQWTGQAVYFGGQDQTDVFEQETGIDFTKYTSLFNRDGTYSDTYDTQEINGTWEYENDERVILFDKGDSDEYTVVISKLDDDELHYQQDGIEFRFRR
ncbi:hypothetical protein [Pontibacter mangrovi]|uniref:Lipocalin-like domain-containing protein n=1 Tax=Pontibacter mangrovi TaxID=2589816 RepID=A0A501WB88_9BACT|nr:hypothetical protein [Pontibacter mangrovi]TPE46072.1 hypothetical protein FJM65_01630 [Pontibacter mangrovi]